MGGGKGQGRSVPVMDDGKGHKRWERKIYYLNEKFT